MTKRTVLITAGGTGGHVFPALSIAKKLMPEYDIVWVGAKVGIENDVVPKNNIPLYTINISGLRRKGILKLLLMPFLLLRAFFQAFKIIFSQRPDVIIGFGGYATFPICFIGWIFRVPVIIHEQNSIAGLTNKILSKFANYVLVAYKNVLNSKKTILVGNPVREDILNLESVDKRYSGRSGGLNILVIGGSLGAKVLNDIMPEMCSKLEEFASITHQVGRGDINEVKDSYRKYNIKADVINFIDDMAYEYSKTDLLICRSGASTVSEVMAAGVAAIFIPYPYAVDDHQRFNGLPLVDNNAAYMILQKDITTDKLSNLINMMSREQCALMAKTANSMAIEDSTTRIIDTIKKCIV